MKIRHQCLVISLIGLLSSGCAVAEISPLTIQSKEVHQMQKLSQRQQALIPIAAFAATGNLEKLNQALVQGLEQGLTINEIKAVLVQVYAYAGFPRSLNALTELMQVVEQLKAKGIKDVEGKDSQALPQDYQSLKEGTANQTKLVGQPVTGTLFDFAPEIDEYLKAHLFGDIFSRDVLSWQDREIATVSMLAALEGVQSQLRSHLTISQKQGLSIEQLRTIGIILSEQVSTEANQRFNTELTVLSK